MKLANRTTGQILWSKMNTEHLGFKEFIGKGFQTNSIQLVY